MRRNFTGISEHVLIFLMLGHVWGVHIALNLNLQDVQIPHPYFYIYTKLPL